MSESPSETQIQLRQANARLLLRRRQLGILDDRPILAGVVADAVLIALAREAEEAG